MIFSDSVTQQFSDPRSIGFKGLYITSLKSLPLRQGVLFTFHMPLLLHAVIHQPSHPSLSPPVSPL